MEVGTMAEGGTRVLGRRGPGVVLRDGSGLLVFEAGAGAGMSLRVG